MTRSALTYRLALFVLTLALFVSGAVLAQADPLTIEFSKADPDGDGTWNGTVAGAIEGDVQTILLGADQSEPVWLVSFEGTLDAGDRSLTAHVGGTLDTESGQVSMTGVVTEGYLLGSAVDWRGQLVDADASRFEGTVTFTGARAAAPDATRIVQAYVDALNAHDFDAFALLISENMVSHGLFGFEQPIRGRDAYVSATAANFAAFPDARVEVGEMIAQGNLVALRWTVTGTHTEPMGEMVATGRPVAVPALALFRIEDGRVAEKWYQQDDYGFLAQLGMFE